MPSTPLSAVQEADGTARADLGPLEQADLARARGFWYEAEYRYGQAVRKDPNHGRAHFYRGWALATLQRFGDAATEYQRAAALGYGPAFAHYQAARSLVRGGRIDDAFVALREAIDAGFSHFERMHHEGALRPLHADPRWSELISPFEAEFASAWQTLQDDTASAAESLAGLTMRYPGEGRAHYYYGLSARKIGRYQDAIEHLTASADLGFETPYALYHAAQAAAAAQDGPGVWMLLERALEAGFFDWETLRTEETFADYRRDPRWTGLIARVGLGAAPPLDEARWNADRGDGARDLSAVTPADAGMDSTVLASGIQYLRATRPQTNSVIILRHGRIVYEEYFNGFGPTIPTNVKSASKAIVSASVGTAIQDGAISSLDQPVVDLLPEYFADLQDPNKRRITLRHLLSMTSGLDFDEGGPEITDWLRSNDWHRFYLNQDLVAEPGRIWEYSTASTHLLGAAVARAVGEPLGAYIDRRILTPIGIESAGWSLDPQGWTFAGSDLYLTPRDLARFGQLYLDGGSWDGRQVIPESWVLESTSPQVPDDTDELDLQDYGFAWWHWSAGRYRSFLAAGHGGQFINVTPELDLVVVTTADVHRPQTPPISAFIEGYVFRAITGFE